MQLKTCIQFDCIDGTEEEGFKPELCLYLPSIDSVIYAENSFLLSDKAEISLEFPSNIVFLKEISVKKESFLVLIFDEGYGMAIIDLKNFKVLTQFTEIFPFKILQIHLSSQHQVFLLTDKPSLLKIENFVLFTRLSPELLKERFESGQVVKEFEFQSNNDNMKIKDFYALGQDEFLTVGLDYMISWWKFPSDFSVPSKNRRSQQQQKAHPSILNYFFAKPKPSDLHEEENLLISRYLNESDRFIDKILTSFGSLVVLEDSTHGRLLILDSEHSLIIKTFKGYRNCSAFINKQGELYIWSGNRGILEKWNNIPFDESSKVTLIKEESDDSKASFDQFGNLFIYSKKLNQLKLYN